MKKIIGLALVLVLMVVLFTGCNKQVFDTTYTFERAIISMPDGEIIDGKVQSWRDFEDADQIQVKIDGKQYLVHSSNIVLISK